MNVCLEKNRQDCVKNERNRLSSEKCSVILVEAVSFRERLCAITIHKEGVGTR